MDRASAAETVDKLDMHLIPDQVESNVEQLKETGQSLKSPPCVVNRWAGGSLIRKSKDAFVVSRPRQLVVNVITITIY